jgi:hypothetical protein
MATEKFPELEKLDIKYEKIYFRTLDLSNIIKKVIMFGRNKDDSKKKKIKICGQLNTNSGRYYIFRRRYEDDQKNVDLKTTYFVNFEGYGISEAIFLQENFNVKEILIKEELIKNNGKKLNNYYLIPFEIFMREAVTHIDYSNYFRDVQYIFPKIRRLNIKNPTYWEEKKEQEKYELVYDGVKIENEQN